MCVKQLYSGTNYPYTENDALSPFTTSESNTARQTPELFSAYELPGGVMVNFHTGSHVTLTGRGGQIGRAQLSRAGDRCS